MEERDLVGACGLYCGACPIYRMYKDQDTERLERAAREVFHCQPDDIRCEGCRGSLDHHWSPECRFLACTRERGIAFCYECANFPCDDLCAFSADRRDIPLSNLRRLAEVGFEVWLAEQEARWRCPTCSASGQPQPWRTRAAGSGQTGGRWLQPIAAGRADQSPGHPFAGVF